MKKDVRKERIKCVTLKCQPDTKKKGQKGNEYKNIVRKRGDR